MKTGLFLDAPSNSSQAPEQVPSPNGCGLGMPRLQVAQVARRVVHPVRGRPGPDDRPPLPAGHPRTWDCINEGTCIAGAPYPFPVFLP